MLRTRESLRCVDIVLEVMRLTDPDRLKRRHRYELDRRAVIQKRLAGKDPSVPVVRLREPSRLGGARVLVCQALDAGWCRETGLISKIGVGPNRMFVRGPKYSIDVDYSVPRKNQKWPQA